MNSRDTNFTTTIEYVDQYVGPAVALTSEYLARGPSLSFTAADIVTAFQTIYTGVRTVSLGGTVSSVSAELVPAVPIKKSVTDDWIVCLDDGKKFKSLRRHLAVLGMTPAEYRAKWGLPADYPMTAPGYSKRRRELAVSIGLGKR